jgi:NAD dependent epimerase/dehydratase family enzyme
MAQIVTGGVRMVPARAGQLGYRYRHPDLAEALGAALA